MINKNETIYDPKLIADKLNEYFVTVGHNLASKLQPVDHDHNFYMKNAATQSFVLFPTDLYEVHSIISSFSINKAKGPDNISNRMLKIGVDSLSVILSDLILHP